jgi:SAM-dependent methyltransferase
MSDPNKQLFDNYARHHEGADSGRLPEDLEKLKRDRLPRWIDEVPRNSCILDAGCAQGHLLAALQRVGFTDLTGVDLSSQLLQTASRLVPCARQHTRHRRPWHPGTLLTVGRPRPPVGPRLALDGYRRV